MSKSSDSVAAAAAAIANPIDGHSRSRPELGVLPSIAQFAQFARAPYRRRMPFGRFVLLARRDPQLLLAVFLALPVVLIDLIVGGAQGSQIAATTTGFLLLQSALTSSRARAASGFRLAISLGFVLLASSFNRNLAVGAVVALQIPVVAMAAAIGTRSAYAIALVAVGVTLAPAILPGYPTDVRQTALAMTAAEIVLAIGSRRVVASMEHAVERTRLAHARERRWARQLSTVEAIGTVLAREGPRPDVLARIMDILEDSFGYHYPSVYLWDGAMLRLGAQRNYANPFLEIDTSMGVIGRVARTKEAAFVTDVQGDPDYTQADAGVNCEIGVPLLNEDELLGVLNIESTLERRLDADDFATMQIVGDRLAAALALGSERMKLAQRADLLVRLTAFSTGLNVALDPKNTSESIANGAAEVIEATTVILTLRDSNDGDYRAVSIVGGDPSLVGSRILPGEGATGKAIESRAMVVDDNLIRARFPRSFGAASGPDVAAAMAIPLIRDDECLGALAWFRADLTRPYSSAEQEVAALLGVQTSLALVNQRLLSDARVAAVTDPLTGLHNRRFFDAAMAHLIALRGRQPQNERQPLAAVVFDLDHFGLINKRHGHQVGDQILRSFADTLKARVRSSDLIARYGGEEFVVLLPGATRDQAFRVADQVRTLFESKRVQASSGEMIGCTVSAGCAGLASSQADGTVLIGVADVGLAMAKAAGRNQVVAA